MITKVCVTVCTEFLTLFSTVEASNHCQENKKCVLKATSLLSDLYCALFSVYIFLTNCVVIHESILSKLYYNQTYHCHGIQA